MRIYSRKPQIENTHSKNFIPMIDAGCRRKIKARLIYAEEK